ncbi:MAG: gamma-glutamyltransferase [Aeromicrobium sp.]|nr:gamma-glutamyltransferase [Aeromicrobium sp.]
MIATRPELRGDFGMAASTHWLATAAAMSVLERGGNAADAAVAAGFVMQIVEPHLSGPGGDLAGLIWSADDSAASEICGQGVSPTGVSIDGLRSLGLELVPGSGLLAATVPGAFGAWLTILDRWGTWELPDVLAYALHHAEDGFPLLPGAAASIAAVRELFVNEWTPSGDAWLDHGRAPAANELWRLPGTARTYRRILAEATGATREARIEGARAAFYEGFVADEIERFNRTAWLDSSGDRHSGHLTAADLAGWRASTAAPLSVDFADSYTLLKTGPWGQGPVLAQEVRLFDEVGLMDHPVRSADWIHLLTECAKLAFADREAWYGDPVDANVPLETLISQAYAAERSALIGDSASSELRPGSPDGRTPVLADLPAASAAAGGSVGEPTLQANRPARGDTCHVDVIDRWGNLLSVTPSGGWLQGSPVILELGFPLGTRAQMFYLQPDLPNSLRPGVRPRTTLTPSIVLRDGRPWIAMGTPGGDQQDQWQSVLLADLVQSDRAGSYDLQASIDAPMFHTTHFPSSFYPRESFPRQLVVEDRLDPTVIAELARREHEVVRSGAWTLGRLSAVAKESDHLRAAANARGGAGYAAGR